MRENKPVARATLIGPFRLTAFDGQDLTPRGAKHTGLLALLLMAPKRSRSREYLMDKLWSNRQPEQAANSLKGALSDLRRSLSSLSDILETRGQMVGLRPGAVTRDIDENPDLDARDEEFLEGLSVRDPEFVDWLRDQRLSMAKSRINPCPPVIWMRRHAAEDILHADMLSVGISKGLSDWCAMQIVAADGEEPNLGGSADEIRSRLIMDTRAVQGDAQVATSLRLTHEKSGRELWSRADCFEADPAHFLNDTTAHRLINHAVDRTVFDLGTMLGRSPETEYLERGAIGAIRLIYRCEGDDLDHARRQLSWNYEMHGAGIYLAWSAYALSFLKAERNRPNDQILDEAEELARKALEIEPYNAMVLALCSYAYSYLLGKPTVGNDLADRSITANRSNPLAWAFKSAALYALRHYEAAFSAAERARAIAGDGPYRYAIETFYCIAAMLSGRPEEAINAGEIARLLKPGFRAPLRCLALLYAARNDVENFQEVVGLLRAEEPGFSMDELLEGEGYPSSIIRQAKAARLHLK